MLALSLYHVCLAQGCPTSVLLAAAQAIASHNADPEPPYTAPRYGPGSYAANLPSAQTMTTAIINKATSEFTESIFSSMGVSQPRECMVHGCIQEDDTKIIKIEMTTDDGNTEDASRRKSKGGSAGSAALAGQILRGRGSEGNAIGDFTHVQPEDIIAEYTADTPTLHWLWRLQGDEEHNWDGVSFDLLKIGNSTVRVYCKTLQQYEPGWLTLCWLIFGVRLALLILLDGILVSTTIRCEASLDMSSGEFKRLDTDNDGVVSRAEFVTAYGEHSNGAFDKADTNHDGALSSQEFKAKEAAFLDCKSSIRLWVLLVAFFLLDMGSLLNPIVNPTAVQQGEFKWASAHLGMVDLLGFTACKLELALIPSIITTSGRMLTGDDDIDMEIFLFQMAIFVLPIILGKMGYGFEVNPSTIFTCFTAVVVGIRFALRCHEDPIFLELYCSDDAREALEEAGDGPDAVLMQAALCVLPAEQRVEQDWLCSLRQCILGTVGDAPACSPSEEESNPVAESNGDETQLVTSKEEPEVRHNVDHTE